MTLERRTELRRGKPLHPGGKPLTAKKGLARKRAIGSVEGGKTVVQQGDTRTESNRWGSDTRGPDENVAPLPRRPNRQERRAAQRKRAVDTGPTAKQREQRATRDGDRCVMCGRQGATNDHHREGRGSGGRKGTHRAQTNGIAYRLSLCGSGTTGCHGIVTDPGAFGYTRDQMVAWGYVMNRNAPRDPATVPVLTGALTDSPRWQVFTHDGQRLFCPVPRDGDARNYYDEDATA